MWNRHVRRVLRLPYATHTRFLPLIMDISSARDQIYSRFLKMCNMLEISDNVRVRYLTCCSMASPRSIIGTNLDIIGRRLHLNQSSLKAKGIGLLKNMYIRQCIEDDLRALSSIHECRGYMNGTQVINGFKLDEIEMILDFICTE